MARQPCAMVAEDDPQFCRFWMIYPNRSAKKDARKAWMQIGPTPETVERILAALAWQVQQPQWLKDGGQYIPLPATWLRGERWTDEPLPMRSAAVIEHPRSRTTGNADAARAFVASMRATHDA